MRYFFLLIFLCDVASAAKAIECKSKGTGLQGTFRLANRDSGNLDLWANGTRYQCPLKVSGFDATPGGQLSQVILRFERQDCKPAMAPMVSHKLFDDVRLRVISRGITARARTQWLRFEQPGSCEVTHVNWKQLLVWAGEWKTATRRGE